jgi:hypothetical protein
MKEICQNNSENDKKELFSEIISIIEEERKIVKSKKDFNKSSYFKSGEIRGCLQEIFKVVNKRLSNELTE